MLKELLKNKKLMSKIKEIIKEEKDILDLIIFGSSLKGKDKPEDFDVLIIYKNKFNLDLNYEIKKEFEKTGVKADITAKQYSDLFKPDFVAREAFLSEGYSLIQKKFIADGLGFKPMVLFRYELGNFNKSQRMRFYYSLYGRTTEGIIKKLKLYKFSERVILSPVDKSEKVKEYLNSWNIQFVEFPILLPMRLLDSKVLNDKK